MAWSVDDNWLQTKNSALLHMYQQITVKMALLLFETISHVCQSLSQNTTSSFVASNSRVTRRNITIIDDSIEELI